MDDVEEFREDIRTLLFLMGRVVETAGDRLLLEACSDVLRERLDRLEQSEPTRTH